MSVRAARGLAGEWGSQLALCTSRALTGADGFGFLEAPEPWEETKRSIVRQGRPLPVNLLICLTLETGVSRLCARPMLDDKDLRCIPQGQLHATDAAAHGPSLPATQSCLFFSWSTVLNSKAKADWGVEFCPKNSFFAAQEVAVGMLSLGEAHFHHS